MAMTRQEFEEEFRVFQDAYYIDQYKHYTSFYDYFAKNAHKLSHDALRFIQDNLGHPFSLRQVDKATELLAFEDIVLK